MILSTAFKERPESPIPFDPKLIRMELMNLYPALSQYDVSLLYRRVYNRMLELGICQFSSYCDYIKKNPDELEILRQ